jgi:hypothetical protein
MAHVKKTMKSESGKKNSMGKKWFTHVLKTAKRTYKKHGGGDEAAPASTEESTMGGRRHRKTRRHSRK